MSIEPRYRESHEIHLRRSGKWTIDYMGLKPMQAGELAQTAFRAPDVDGLRIVRSRESMITGAVIEETLLEKSRSAPPAEALIGTVEDAPYCQRAEDLFAARARLTLNRLFQGWLRVHEVAVTECLLSTRLIERLMDGGSLIQSATFAVAQMQIPEAGDPSRRRAQLLGFMDDLRVLTRNTERISKTHNGEDTGRDPDEAALSPFVALWRTGETLFGLPNRLAKIERLALSLDTVESRSDLDSIDHFLSDFFMDEELVLEIAGPYSNLIEPLHWAVEVATGAGVESAKPSPYAFMSAIVQAIGADRLPRTRQALLWSLDALLRETTPLRDQTPGGEKSAILLLTRHLASADVFGGGPRLASRLTRRFSEFEDRGGTNGFLEAAETLTIDLGDVRRQVRYLVALLSGSTIGRAKVGLMRVLDNAIRLYGGPEKLVASDLPTHAIILEFDAMCALLESAEIGPKSRETWNRQLVTCMVSRFDRDHGNGADMAEFLRRFRDASALTSECVPEEINRKIGEFQGTTPKEVSD